MRGLTTAAAVWISAAIGMAAALRFYSLALTGAALVLVALLLFRRMRGALMRRVRTDRLLLEVELEPARMREVFAVVAEHGAVL